MCKPIMCESTMNPELNENKSGIADYKTSCPERMTPLLEPAPVSETPVGHDAGALSTAITVVKSCWFFVISKASLAYKFFVKPSHVIMLLGVLLVAVSMVPKNTSIVEKSEAKLPRTLFKFYYLAAFYVHLGSQICMMLISALNLFFNLCKHTFGEDQEILFPKYYGYNSLFSAIILLQFDKIHSTTIMGDENTLRQLCMLCICFLLELMIWLYLVPSLSTIMTGMIAIEKSAGFGTILGYYGVGPLASCPHYIAMRQEFARIHKLMVVGNIVTILCSVIHLAYFAA